ncbi:MAG: extracellular solute-binding protein [Oligoflexales bacterium]|nr:extracellular solute-binding protein [Oligoflexales bacterium]
MDGFLWPGILGVICLNFLFFQTALLGAGKEVRVITDRTEAHVAPLFKMYEEKYQVKIKPLFVDEGLIARLEARPEEADVVITKNADLLEIMKGRKLLSPFSSKKITGNIPNDFLDEDSSYFVLAYRARMIFYSRDRVKVSDLSTYEDLASPKWKGKICIRSGYHEYNISLFTQMAAVYGIERTEKFIRGLKANLAKKPSGNDREQVKGIYEGKCDIAIANSYYMGIMMSNKDQKPWALSAGTFFPNQEEGGTFVMTSGASLTRAGKNSAEALRLLEYLSDYEAGDYMTEATFEYPVHSKKNWPEIVTRLGEGQPGIKEGVFRRRVVPFKDLPKFTERVVKILNDVNFDDKAK